MAKSPAKIDAEPSGLIKLIKDDAVVEAHSTQVALWKEQGWKVADE